VATIEAWGSGYKLRWEDDGVDIYVKRIRGTSYGEDIKAEIAVTLQGQGLTRSSPVLTTEAGKDALIRKLERRRPRVDFSLDWEVIVEEMAGLIIDSYRQGEVEVSLSEVEESEAAIWRVEGIMPEGQPSLVFGDGGSGKSLLACLLATCIDQGYSDTSLRMAVEPGRVMYLDWETDATEIAKRVRMIHAGLGLEAKTGIVYRRMTQALRDDVDRIVDIVEARSIDVVICDSLGLATGGSLEDAESVLGFFGALRIIDRTSLVISHINKAGVAFGSVYANNSSRMSLEARGTPNAADGIDLAVFHRKANNVALQPPRAWHITFSDQAIEFAAKDVFSTESAGAMSINDLVFRVVNADGPMDRETLAATIAAYKNSTAEKVRSAISVAVSRHKRLGHLEENKEKIIKIPAVELVDTSPAKAEAGKWQF
jgi:archaellum biogenesis ATPase FlaH